MKFRAFSQCKGLVGSNQQSNYAIMESIDCEFLRYGLVQQTNMSLNIGTHFYWLHSGFFQLQHATVVNMLHFGPPITMIIAEMTENTAGGLFGLLVYMVCSTWYAVAGAKTALKSH